MRIATLLIFILFISTTSCNLKTRIETQSKAQKEADYIMNNLDKPDVLSHFPEQYFPKPQTEKFLNEIKQNCDWQNKQGIFVDYYTMYDNGKNNVAFIYEYILKCDSLRFILIYNIDEKNPKLFNFRFEPIEKECKMIIDPTKQLLYKK